MSSHPASASASPAPIEFARPAVSDAELESVLDVLRSGWLTTGPRVHDFERAVERRLGRGHAVATNSCTAALHLGLVLHGVGPGDEVVTTPLTFCSTANVVEHVGARLALADIDPTTWNLDPAAAAAAVTRQTRAVIPVHYAGRPVDVGSFRAIAQRANAALIEDAAHAFGAVSREGAVGTTGDITAFSFYATKNLSTGEGGMLLTPARPAAARAASSSSWRGSSTGR